MKYEVRLSHDAASYLRRLSAPTRDRVMNRLRKLAEDPIAHSKLLENADGRRSSRVGGFRIILTVDLPNKRVEVSHISPRGQAYRQL